jgi:hypothetical protein
MMTFTPKFVWAGIVGVLVLGYIIFRPTPVISPEEGSLPLASTTEALPSEFTSEDVSSPRMEPSTTSGSPTPSGASAIPSSRPTPSTSGSMRTAPELDLVSGFSNTDPFRIKDLLGAKVLLVSFQNFTTQHSLRTLPYLNQWHDRYRHKGLTVITVHTPRYAIDKTKVFVDQEAFRYGVTHPLVLDNQSGSARSWGNTEWPTLYLVDIHGKIVNTYRGEGNYSAIEVRIQELLKERTAKLKLPPETYFAIETPAKAVAVDTSKILTPETFFGSSRNGTLGNGTSFVTGMQDMKAIPAARALGVPYLSGSWEFTPDFAKSSLEKNTIVYRYSAKHVYFLLGSLKMSRVKVTLDGEPLGAQMGKDVRVEKGETYLYVTDDRLYEIVKGETYGEHTLELTVETPGLEVYAVTFG